MHVLRVAAIWILVVGSLVLLVQGCSSSAGAGLVGLAANGSNKSEDAGSAGTGSGTAGGAGSSAGADAETDTANTPQQVTGAFLTCAYMDSEPNVAKDATTQPTAATIQVGCALFQKPADAVVEVDLTGLTLASSIACDGEAPVVLPPLQRFAPGSALQFSTYVAGRQLPCVFRLGLSDNVGRTARFAKTLSTISQFNGSAGFDVDADIAASDLQYDAGARTWSVVPAAAAPASPAPDAAANAAAAAASSAAQQQLLEEIAFSGGLLGGEIAKANENANSNGTNGIQTHK